MAQYAPSLLQQTQTKLTDVYMSGKDVLPGKLRVSSFRSICLTTAVNIMEANPDWTTVCIMVLDGAQAKTNWKNKNKSRNQY